MGSILSWLGLGSGDAYPNVEALTRQLRRSLPNTESCVVRYVTIVVVLLARVAWADGGFSDVEEAKLRKLLAYVEGLDDERAVDAVCRVVAENVKAITEEELQLCYRELKALCDGKERIEVLRLLNEIAAVDGRPSKAERNEIEQIATEIGVPLSALQREVGGLRDEPSNS